MKHIKDIQFRGHEIIILQDNTTGFYSVDVRADATDGDIIAGYSDFTTSDDAKYCAMAFIDGMHRIMNNTVIRYNSAVTEVTAKNINKFGQGIFHTGEKKEA